MRARLLFVFALLLWGRPVCADPTPGAEGIPPLPSVVQWHATPSGLQYADTALGNGPTPNDGQIVVVHFVGWLDDGTKFDSTRDRGKPFGFPLGSGQVIRGWDEGVRGMRVGGKRRLVVPPALGYGEKGVPPIVPPNARLIFDVELVRVLDKPPERRQ
ncbi:FKBP-type peptidyl-prolyl cis-trans isomerase [bacterium]|nr:FKBP-type peptidyl-prolyl cis-trans isomerase [bacterium]